MISVIIPTVQKKLLVLSELLKILSRDKSIGEIIIINNKPECPLKFSRLKKVRIITPKENLFVNESWNLGVKEAKFNDFVLMNDDLLICSNFCQKIVDSDVFQSPNTGLLGLNPSSIKNFEKDEEMLEKPICKKNQKPFFQPLEKHLGTNDWGITIFGKKENYYHIPSKKFKIIYGDNYLLLKNKENKKTNYKIYNLPVYHIHSASSSSKEFTDIIINDYHEAKKYFPELSPHQKTSYKLSYNLNACFVEIIKNEKKLALCLKYRDENGIYSIEILKQKILDHLPQLAPRTISKLAENIAQENSSF